MKDEESDLTLKEFRAYIQAKHQLEGALTFFHKGKNLTNLMAKLSDVLRPGDALVISTDKSVAVASGGVGMGAHAQSGNGGLATAKGGYGTGGNYQGGMFRGGRGLGGDGLGTTGSAGCGYGGTAATALAGPVRAGRGAGGNFIRREGQRFQQLNQLTKNLLINN